MGALTVPPFARAGASARGRRGTAPNNVAVDYLSGVLIIVLLASAVAFWGWLEGAPAPGIPFAVLLCAVALIAWRCGFGPALFACALGSAILYPRSLGLTQEPGSSTSLDISPIIFAVQAIIVAALTADLRSARRLAESSAGAVRRLQAVSDAALAHLSRDELLGALLTRIHGLLEIDVAVVLLLDERAGTLILHAASGENVPPIGTRFSLGRGVVGRAISERQPMVAERLDPRDPGHGPWIRNGLATVVAAPLLAEGRPLGALCVGTRRATEVDPDTLRLIQLIADRVTAALERARRYESERAARAEAEAAERRAAFLADASALLDASLDYDVVLEALASLATPTLGDWCVLDLADAEGRLRRVAVTPATPSLAPASATLAARYPHGPDDPYGPGRVLRTGDLELLAATPPPPSGNPQAATNDSQAMPPELGAYRGLLRDLGVASALCVPLRARRRTLGVFSFLAADPRRTFTPADLAFARDLAHRAALALDHARLHRSTRQALRARDDFLAAASHELRTPLSHIKGFVSSLRQTDVAWDDATRQDFLAEIERESDRLALLIDDLLDLSRLERVGPDRAPVRPAALIAAAIDHVRGALSAHPITLDVADDLPSVPVDAHQIERVLSNLLDNAAKYSPAGAPIHVSAALRHNLLEIAVEDRGPGVPENLRSRIFEQFFRAPEGRGPSVPGTGLGLAIARSIVLAHGGAISVSNRPEGGARFSFSLPLAVPTAPQPPASDQPTTVST